jgi:hypothetical protein
MSTIDELKTAAEAAQHALAEALADGNALPITKARKAAQEAAQAVSDAVAVQEVLRQRAQATEAERLAEIRKQQRAKIAELAAERGEVAEQIARLVEKLGPQFARLNDLHKEILIQLPGGFDATRAAMTGASDRLLEELWRAGLVSGSPFSQWELDRRPRLTQQVVEGNSYLRSL